eukprot:1521724-Rhodomonas_salina.3
MPASDKRSAATRCWKARTSAAATASLSSRFASIYGSIASIYAGIRALSARSADISGCRSTSGLASR